MHVPFWKNASIKKLKSSNVATLGVAAPKKIKQNTKIEIINRPNFS